MRRAGQARGPCAGVKSRYQTGMDDTRITALEEQVAHMSRMVEDLSEVVARQDRDLALLATRVQMLAEREAQREVDEGGTVPLADQKPPHW